MKIVFTICSNNYLPQARTLGKSIKLTNPDWTYFIVLVDRRQNEIEYRGFGCETVIDIESVQISGFERMTLEYNVIELSTSVKAALFRHFFETFLNADYIMYLDPDIMVFSSFEPILGEMGANAIALTPHSLSPVPEDQLEPQENLFLNHGIYNLGFLLLRRDREAHAMLEWWESRLGDKCVIDLLQGYFVDQLWMNLVPLYFQRTVALRNPGLNMAYWNFHERRVSERAGETGAMLINDRDALVFFHFSSYKPLVPDSFCWRGLSRYRFEDRPDLHPLFTRYRDELLRHGFLSLHEITPYFEVRRESLRRQRREAAPVGLKRRFMRILRDAIPVKTKQTIKNLLCD